MHFDGYAQETLLVNCIVWGSDAGDSQEIFCSSGLDNLTISNSIVRNYPDGFIIEPGNSSDDPLLEADGHLTTNSLAAIDQGVELGLGLDIDLENRPFGSAPDIGADESTDANPNLDTDLDGMTDMWELANGLDPESAEGDDGADGDPDSDGYRNLEEFAYLTDPQSDQSTVAPMVYTYDDLDRLEDAAYPNGSSVTYDYDDDGNLEEVR